MNTFIVEWSHHQAAANLRPRTIKERATILASLERHVGKPIEQAERRDLILWLAREGLSGSTRQNYRSLLYRFYTWLQDEGYRPDNPAARLPKVHVVAPTPDPVTTEGIQRLLGSVYRPARVKILLYALAGMRASELAAIKGEHIDVDRKTIHIPEGKGGKEAWLPLHPVIEAIARDMPAGYWFPSERAPHGHVTGASVSHVLSLAMRRAGLARHRPHQLRAWFATEMLRGGVDSAIVQACMRHSSADTLKRYALPSEAQTMAAVTSLPSLHVPSRVNRQRAA